MAEHDKQAKHDKKATYKKIGTKLAIYSIENKIIKSNKKPMSKKKIKWDAKVIFTQNGQPKAVPFINVQNAQAYAKQIHEIYGIKTEIHLTQKKSNEM